MRYGLYSALFLGFATCAFASDWQERIATVRRSYSVESVDDLIAGMTTADAPAALAEAYLIKAEILRFEWEILPEDADDREHVADELDAAAWAGIERCKLLSESSETFRLRADLLGTLIRSRYRAKKHRAEMEADAERAIELDSENARAYVSKAKPFLFASERHGGDIETAIELLDKALELDDSLETAKLLRAYGLEQLDKRDEALAVYREVLQRNPQCRPAAHAISELER
jgi:tetratricopeptide (TPR) repeat protein